MLVYWLVYTVLFFVGLSILISTRHASHEMEQYALDTMSSNNIHLSCYNINDVTVLTHNVPFSQREYQGAQT